MHAFLGLSAILVILVCTLWFLFPKGPKTIERLSYEDTIDGFSRLNGGTAWFTFQQVEYTADIISAEYIDMMWGALKLKITSLIPKAPIALQEEFTLSLMSANIHRKQGEMIIEYTMGAPGDFGKFIRLCEAQK